MVGIMANSQSSHASVLLVEDDATIADMYCLQLARDGYSVEIARNGDQALKSLREAPADVVLLDVHMPQVDGWAVLEELGSGGTLSHPVIMMSSYSDPEMVSRAIRMGATDWLVKAQTTPGELSRRLAFWLEALERTRQTPSPESFEAVTDADGRSFMESPVAMLVADDYARYVAANPAALTLLDCRLEEVIGQRVWDFTPGGSVASGLELWRQFIGIGEIRGRYELLRPSGQRIPVEYHALASVSPGRHLSRLTLLPQ